MRDLSYFPIYWLSKILELVTLTQCRSIVSDWLVWMDGGIQMGIYRTSVTGLI